MRLVKLKIDYIHFRYAYTMFWLKKRFGGPFQEEGCILSFIFILIFVKPSFFIFYFILYFSLENKNCLYLHSVRFHTSRWNVTWRTGKITFKRKSKKQYTLTTPYHGGKNYVNQVCYSPIKIIIPVLMISDAEFVWMIGA